MNQETYRSRVSLIRVIVKPVSRRGKNINLARGPTHPILPHQLEPSSSSGSSSSDFIKTSGSRLWTVQYVKYKITTKLTQ